MRFKKGEADWSMESGTLETSDCTQITKQGISYLLQWNREIYIENNLAVRLCVHKEIDAIKTLQEFQNNRNTLVQKHFSSTKQFLYKLESVTTVSNMEEKSMRGRARSSWTWSALSSDNLCTLIPTELATSSVAAATCISWIREKWLARNIEMKVHDNSRAVSMKELSLHSIPTNKMAMDLKLALCTSETSTKRLPGFCNTATTTCSYFWELNPQLCTQKPWKRSQFPPGENTPRVDDKREN